MLAILHALVMFVADLFKSRTRLEAETLFLRHQLTIALRQTPPHLRLRGSDRALRPDMIFGKGQVANTHRPHPGGETCP